MLNVVNSEQAQQIISSHLPVFNCIETVSLSACIGRISARNVFSTENVPAFDRSVVDGFAVKASDTFGCSQSLPSVLRLTDEVIMGNAAYTVLDKGTCQKIPTGGCLPDGADAVVMLEYCEDYNDGYIYVGKPAAVYENVVRCGDDIKVGEPVLKRGTCITARSVGILSSLGIDCVTVYNIIKIGLISTGDEIIPYTQTPQIGQIRDINTILLSELLLDNGTQIKQYPIVRDDIDELTLAVKKAVTENDIVVISGGSSAGDKDAAYDVLSLLGEVYFHGIAIKPGKPTMFSVVNTTPVFALPGHPLAAALVTELFVKPAIYEMRDSVFFPITLFAKSSVKIPSDHGRESVYPVTLQYSGNEISCTPLYSKSGVISVLQKADGYIRIDRDCEGVNESQTVKVYLFARQI